MIRQILEISETIWIIPNNPTIQQLKVNKQQKTNAQIIHHQTLFRSESEPDTEVRRVPLFGPIVHSHVHNQLLKLKLQQQ